MKNGISVSGLSEFAHEAQDHPEEAAVSYGIKLDWETGTRSRAEALTMMVGPHRVARSFTWTVDEPHQILGTNHAPNPQEYFLSGLGACLMVSFLVGATTRGVQLESLEVELEGALDLRGFLSHGQGDAQPSVGFEGIRYHIRARGDAAVDVIEEIHRDAVAQSPNVQTILEPTSLSGEIEYEMVSES